jgi:hypothetical protein
MALPNLASASDLSDRDVESTSLLETMLGVASSIVRSAAGSPILETTSTLSMWIQDDGDTEYLSLPGQPVTNVASVAIEGEDVTDFRLVYGRLWMGRWRPVFCGVPLEVLLTLTHGLSEVPADIVQLVCDLAILGAAAAPDGAHDPNVLMESIDDYRVTFAPAGESVASAMELPRMTRQALKARFGGGVGMVTWR